MYLSVWNITVRRAAEFSLKRQTATLRSYTQQLFHIILTKWQHRKPCRHKTERVSARISGKTPVIVLICGVLSDTAIRHHQCNIAARV